MRNHYGISAWSLAIQTFKKILAWTTLAGAAVFGAVILLTSSPTAAPETAAQSETGVIGVTAPEPFIDLSGPTIVVNISAINVPLVTLMVLAGLFAAYLVVRRVLGPVSRGDFPFGPTQAGL